MNPSRNICSGTSFASSLLPSMGWPWTWSGFLAFRQKLIEMSSATEPKFRPCVEKYSSSGVFFDLSHRALLCGNRSLLRKSCGMVIVGLFCVGSRSPFAGYGYPECGFNLKPLNQQRFDLLLFTEYRFLSYRTCSIQIECVLFK